MGLVCPPSAPISPVNKRRLWENQNGVNFPGAKMCFQPKMFVQVWYIGFKVVPCSGQQQVDGRLYMYHVDTGPTSATSGVACRYIVLPTNRTFSHQSSD